MYLLEVLRRDKTLRACSVHVILSIIVFSIINYLTFSRGIADGPEFIPYILWVFVYISSFIPGLLAGWPLNSFGLAVSRVLLLIVAVSAALGVWVFLALPNWRTLEPWSASLVKAFGLVGEEMFFRGYVYLVLLKLFNEKRRPYLWAIWWSSVAFALVHTQVLLPGNQISLGTVFIAGLLMAYLRHLTGSVLPAITIHCFLNGHLLAVVGGWALYAILAYWSAKVDGRTRMLRVAA